MADVRNRLLVVQVAALGWDMLQRHGVSQSAGLSFAPAETVFPATTCPVQASFRTMSRPSDHGMIANGRYFPELHRVMFWEQASSLVTGRRLWEELRSDGGRVTMLFWQQSLGESVDGVVSPAPIHKHHGGMIPGCYSCPAGLAEELQKAVGRAFALQHYWGPMASVKASDWIADATAALLQDTTQAPDLCFTYLPGLDYDLQRYGPNGDRAAKALAEVAGQMERLVTAARAEDYDVVIFGDYAIAESPRGAAFPNIALAEAGLLATRDVRGMRYPDLHASRAFAVVDHEIAHVYIRDAEDVPRTRDVLAGLPGVDAILDDAQKAAWGIDHDHSGELVLVAGDGYWFAYPWWQERREAPDFAGHVDIHNKPGYDPCELFWGWPPGTVSQDVSRIRGSHGRTGPGREVACAWSFEDDPAETLLDVSRRVARWSHSSGV